MFEITIRIVGDSTDEFEDKIQQIRRFVMQTLQDGKYLDLEIRTQENAFYPPSYGYRRPNTMFGGPRIPSIRTPSTFKKSTLAYILSTREEAENVLATMNKLLDNYNVATMSDLKELLGVSPTFAETSEGWTTLKDVQIRQIREGWLIEFPLPESVPVSEKKETDGDPEHRDTDETGAHHN